jgi:hypothetical protein
MPFAAIMLLRYRSYITPTGKPSLKDDLNLKFELTFHHPGHTRHSRVVPPFYKYPRRLPSAVFELIVGTLDEVSKVSAMIRATVPPAILSLKPRIMSHRRRSLSKSVSKATYILKFQLIVHILLLFSDCRYRAPLVASRSLTRSHFGCYIFLAVTSISICTRKKTRKKGRLTTDLEALRECPEWRTHWPRKDRTIVDHECLSNHPAPSRLSNTHNTLQPV